MKILVACEFSGVVKRAFRIRGHDAWSCDLLSDESESGNHIQGDVLAVIPQGGWDMLVGFPPCTHLCSSGARWWRGKRKEQQEAVDFFLALWRAPVGRVALENPVGIMSTVFQKPTQYNDGIH